mgnify:FL=1
MYETEQEEQKVELEGFIEKIIFTNKETGWSVLAVHPKNEELGMKEITVTGVIFEARKNDEIHIKGVWIHNAKYGKQIKASELKIPMPTSIHGIYKLLKTKDFLPGVGPMLAQSIVDKFGVDTFRIFDEEPERLLEIKGITKKKHEKIMSAYHAKTQMQDLLAFCATYNISQNMAHKIFFAYGDSAVTIVSRNPYLLTELGHGVKGIGFKKADLIAKKLGLPMDSHDRKTHGIVYYQNECAAKKGGVAVPRDELIEEASEALELPYENIENTLDEMLTWTGKAAVLTQDVLGDETCIWSRSMYYKELFVAHKILSLSHAEPNYYVPSNVEELIKETEEHNNIELADKQREALIMAIKSNFSVITGGPGVGKTTIIRCLISVLAEGNRIALAAPTGRAAKRMKDATKHRATTIHRLLGCGSGDEDEEEDDDDDVVNEDDDTASALDYRFDHNAKNPLKQDVFVIDESSMVDISLMKYLLEAIPDGKKVIIVGDVDQLPSVGPGKVLEDIIRSGAVPVCRLDVIYRQAKESKIITASHDINHGRMPKITNQEHDDFFLIQTADNISCANMVRRLAQYIPNKFGCDPLWDVQVLSPKRASDVGTEALNRALQEDFIPDVAVKRAQLEIKERMKHKVEVSDEDKKVLNQKINTPIFVARYNIYAVGDKVMQTVNSYQKGVFNGDIGQIIWFNTEYLDRKEDVEDFAIVAFPSDDGSGTVEKKYSKEELKMELTLAYACTVHKSQGSEYPFVIIPIMPTFSIMLQRKLLYTGVTRGRKLVCLVGQEDAVKKAVRDVYRKYVSNRRTKLQYWLTEGQHSFVEDAESQQRLL